MYIYITYIYHTCVYNTYIYIYETIVKSTSSSCFHLVISTFLGYSPLPHGRAAMAGARWGSPGSGASPEAVARSRAISRSPWLSSKRRRKWPEDLVE